MANTLHPSPPVSGPPRVRHFTPFQRWGSVGLMFVASMINYIDRGSLSMALPLISTELNFSPTQQGFLLSGFFWSYALMQMPIGWAVDRFNAKWVYAIAFALWSMACGFTGFAGSLAVLMATRIVLGIGESAYLPSSTKIVTQLFPPKKRGFPTGLFECGTAVGTAVGSIATAYLIVQYGWRIMFMIVGFAALLWLIPWSLFVPSRRELISDSASESKLPLPSPRRRRIITFNRNLLGICAGLFFFNYRWYLLLTWLPSYLIDVRGMSILKVGLWASLPPALYAILQPIGGILGDFLICRGFDETKVRKGLVGVGFIFGLLILPVPLVENVYVAIALLTASSLVGISVANMLVIQQTCAPPEQVGIWAGTMNFSGNVAGIVASVVTGLLVQQTGSYFIPFALGAVAMIPAFVSYVFVVEKVEPPAEDGPEGVFGPQ